MQDHPLRIAMISEHASPLAALGGVDAGGQNVYVAHVSRCLARAGHHVDVLTRRSAREQPAAVDVCPGMRVLHIDAGPAQPIAKEALLRHMPAFGHAARQLLGRSVGYDLVHANFFMSGLVGLRLQQQLELPLVTTFHALGLVRRRHQAAADGFPAERIDIERSIVRRADRLIAECPQDRDDLLQLYGADPKKIATVPCGVDLSEFAPASKARARRELGLADDDFVVLQLGRMVPRKGIDNVIRAVACMGPGASHGGTGPAGTGPASTGPGSTSPARRPKLLIVGGDAAEPDERLTPEIGRLRRIAAECGIGEDVIFTGQRQRSQLRACYAACDVFVSTPWYEPFGITPLEAMACGRPVVGSAVGGIQYSVVDEVTGFLVPPRDPQALAARLVQLRANPALAEALGRAGTHRVRSRFTWERVARELLAVYEPLCSGRDRSRAAAGPVVRTEVPPMVRLRAVPPVSPVPVSPPEPATGLARVSA